MEKLTLESPVAIAHVEMLQGIINRMGSNSSNCKNMAIAAIVGIFTLSSIEGFRLFLATAVFTLLMFLIDSMYLGLEKTFISQQKEFVDRVAAGEDVSPLRVESASWNLRTLFGGMRSWSTTLFYLLLFSISLLITTL